MSNVPGTSSKKKSYIDRITDSNMPDYSASRPSKIKEMAMPLFTAFELTLGNHEKRIKAKAKPNYRYKLTTNTKPLKQVGTQIPSISNFTENFQQQTEPPTIPVAKIFSGCKFPVGENMQHSLPKDCLVASALSHMTTEEKQQIEITQSDYYNCLRHAAEIHRQTRQHMASYIKPGMLLYNICEELENTVQRLLYENDSLKAGLAFPPRFSVNNCISNFTPDTEDTTLLHSSDLCKIDFGTHIKGHIVDSAFTLSFTERYDKLIEVVKEATNAGIKEAGIDVRLCDVGAAMDEVVQSCELELNGRTYPIKIIYSLNGGHLLGPYNLYAGKTIPFKKNKDPTMRMLENECYFIQVFATTGKGILHEDTSSSFYMRTLEKNHIPLRQQSSKHLLCTINRYFGNLGFCKRWLDRVGAIKYQVALDDLCEKGVLQQYLPLYDSRNTYSAQFGHTVLLRPTCKEVLSRGNDY